MSLRWDTVSSITLSNSTFTDVYVTNESRIRLVRAVFASNSDKILMRIVRDTQTILDLDLGALKDDFKNDKRSVVGLEQYENKKWIFAPPIPIEIESELKIQFKSGQGNNKKIEDMIVLLDTRSMPGGGG